jgi:hypothetical protein
VPYPQQNPPNSSILLLDPIAVVREISACKFSPGSAPITLCQSPLTLGFDRASFPFPPANLGQSPEKERHLENL